ncbi:hypothetical protein M9H77_24436 [Catharanthus roseus]|uniref:Uncharacterized protein n=1 Tax=Catharanthus roseus TaxID=4058 RepID=A0ACC0AVT0_CATRO|nr:hypothetical protein M9H77_24436 [Catharanthus roseus]
MKLKLDSNPENKNSLYSNSSYNNSAAGFTKSTVMAEKRCVHRNTPRTVNQQPAIEYLTVIIIKKAEAGKKEESDSPVQIQATGEQQLDRINSNRIKVGSFLPRDPSGLGFGHRQWKTNKLCEFGLTIYETDCPTCSFGEEREESLSSRWPQKRTLSLSVSLCKKLPFPFCLRSHTRATIHISGIRARKRFDLSCVWYLLHSTSDADVIQDLPRFFPDSRELLSSVNLTQIKFLLFLFFSKKSKPKPGLSPIETSKKFDGKSDFVIWRRKIKVVLVQNKIAPAISTPDKYPESWTGEILAEKLGDEHSCLTLHLKDNVLREINETDNAYEIWTKPEKLYLGKSLSNKI